MLYHFCSSRVDFFGLKLTLLCFDNSPQHCRVLTIAIKREKISKSSFSSNTFIFLYIIKHAVQYIHMIHKSHISLVNTNTKYRSSYSSYNGIAYEPINAALLFGIIHSTKERSKIYIKIVQSIGHNSCNISEWNIGNALFFNQTILSQSLSSRHQIIHRRNSSIFQIASTYIIAL
jgi:hypothetical protein